MSVTKAKSNACRTKLALKFDGKKLVACFSFYLIKFSIERSFELTYVAGNEHRCD